MATTPQPPVAVCAAHPERPAVALCVICRTALCPDCTTRFQGINHCAGCVHAAGPSPATMDRGSRAATLLKAAAAYGLVAAIFYAAARVLAR